MNSVNTELTNQETQQQEQPYQVGDTTVYLPIGRGVLMRVKRCVRVPEDNNRWWVDATHYKDGQQYYYPAQAFMSTREYLTTHMIDGGADLTPLRSKTLLEQLHGKMNDGN